MKLQDITDWSQRWSTPLGTSGPVYEHVFHFLKRNHGRKLCKVINGQIDTRTSFGTCSSLDIVEGWR
jgi:hypothetical protein